MFEITNDGEDIAGTSYWNLQHAKEGILYLSGNAKVWRLLLPACVEQRMLPEMCTGKSVTIEPSIQSTACWDIVFEDGTDSPFSIALDKQQVDRKMEPGDCRLTVWTEEGKQLDLPCTVNV